MHKCGNMNIQIITPEIKGAFTGALVTVSACEGGEETELSIRYNNGNEINLLFKSIDLLTAIKAVNTAVSNGGD